jgi:superfamily II DNA or RNA helicase
MPRIFDNIELELLPALRQTIEISEHADFCVGYFNLRGWKSIDSLVDRWSGGLGQQCRLLVGMQRLPQDDLRDAYSLLPHEDQMSNQAVIRLKRRLAEEFRAQLTIGAPTDSDEAGLRRLSAQLQAGKVVVKLHLRHTLHAKLYLCFRPDPNNPVTGFLGSSNLTLSGLSKQGELNVDVLDHDATQKLSRWFNDRWEDRWCVDITKELIQVIDESWARLDCPPPYQIYVKMAYHLAEEARAGLSEFTIPADMRGVLLEFQSAAVRIAARHLEKRGGVVLGDVVGLGKTLMANALARMFQDPPRSLETLILCPKNLVGMWEYYAHRYRLIAKVVSVTQAQNSLPDLRRYRVVIIDESHNLRNREGRRWTVIRDYISRNACKCILLSATPYNKAYLDLANQLRLFLDPEDVVGIRPEEYLRLDLFVEDLAEHLEQDASRLFSILQLAGDWHPDKDEKLAELHKLLTKKHPNEKVLLFSQFADTVDYLNANLKARGLSKFGAVTGDTENPAEFACRFSPESNKARDKVTAADELRVIIATDVLSEGQNLQDAAIIVNFDLPWAIIRLIQRAGRVDRIGQKAEEILCYSFIPADGVERVIRLRARVRQRLQENAEVVGTDETFFEDEKHDDLVLDLFTEKSGILDDPDDDEVDLSSLAYQIWKNACDADPSLKKTIPDMASVVFSTKALSTVSPKPAGAAGSKPDSGVMVYVRTADGNDALAWVDEQGRTVTESQHEILRAAACDPATPALPRLAAHHTLVQQSVAGIQTEHASTGGQLGKPASARRRVYERLKDYASQVKDTLFDIKPLHQAIDAIYGAPLTEAARDLLNREMKTGISDEKLAELVFSLHEEDRLCVQQDDAEAREPKIICSLGIRKD